ncbi:MAG: TIGR00341 family protein [Halobacteriota archaeon]
MRLVEAAIPEGKLDDVVAALEEDERDFVTTEETGQERYSHVVSLPVEDNEVEYLIELLRKNDVESDAYVAVTELETVVREVDDEEEAGEDDKEPAKDRISRDELKTKAEELSRSTPNYVVFTVVSAVVATAGLLEDSASLVVGSMVIAPLIGPAIGASVATVINEDEMFFEGIRSQWLGVVVAISSATAFAILVRFTIAPDVDLLMIQQVAERSHPGLLLLAVALGAGVAGALALTSGMSEALVGVMIAAALIPPAAAVGLGIAYFDRALAVGAAVLVVLNVLSINLGALVTLWAKRYRPENWYEAKLARRATLKRTGALTLLVLVLTSFLVAVTYDERRNAGFENEVEGEIRSLDVDVVSVEYDYSPGVVFREPTRVTATVDGGRDGLAEEIRRSVNRSTGHDVEVVVVREDRETAG